LAGYHEGGYTPFALDVTHLVKYGGANTIAVRVDNPPWDSRTDIVPAAKSDWMNYTGIIHDIYLERLPLQYIVRADIRVLDTNGNVVAKVVLANASGTPRALTADVAVFTAEVTGSNITDPSASALVDSPVELHGAPSQSSLMLENGACCLTYNLGIPSPKLWTPATPNLYVLKITLRSDNVVVDEFYTQFGVRTLGIAPGAKFLLNQHPVFFTGMARHEEWPDTGRTATMDKIKADLDRIKQMNVTFLRTAHYPNHPYTYILADRLGLAVMEEIPTWWFGTYEWADQAQRGIADQMWREMIFRDYNRPSIILWSGTNEAEQTSLERRRSFLTRINRDLKLHYYDGRLVTQSAAADRPGADDHTMNAVDVAGWTMYFGVFHGSTHYQGTLSFLDAAHAAFPTKPILNTEFGYWSNPDDGRAHDQVTTFSETFRAFEDRRAVDISLSSATTGFTMAATWWAAFNWYTQHAALQTMGTSHMDRVTDKLVRASIRDVYAPYARMGGLANSSMTSFGVEVPDAYTLAQPSAIPPKLLQDFEYEDSYYEIWQARASLDSAIKHSDTRSLKMTGTGGEWHTVGIYLYNRPIDASIYTNICVWVYDTIGANTLGLRLVDKYGMSQELWSTDQSVKTMWTQFCFKLDDFNQIDRATLTKAQLTTYWDGVYYFDDIRLQ
jgi:beta-glucuronidase